ncbi:MAG: hypothetical protein JWP97_911 [Labilithrix sp.]|nr:hypothetical protein [Labilithrix sp.]
MMAPLLRNVGLSLSVALALSLSLAACTSGEGDPSTGAYTVDFPSTAAAVATDTVQILIFDPPAAVTDRPTYCQQLIQQRKQKSPQRTVLTTPTVTVCEMLAGDRPITVPYGEHAALAIAKRGNDDFMIGCTLQAFGNGDAPLPISLSLVDVSNPVPDTTCTTVSAFCSNACPAP